MSSAKGENAIKLKSGNTCEEHGSGGVRFIISRNTIEMVKKYRVVTNRIAYIIIEINPKTAIQIIQVYAPASSHEDEKLVSFTK